MYLPIYLSIFTLIIYISSLIIIVCHFAGTFSIAERFFSSRDTGLVPHIKSILFHFFYSEHGKDKVCSTET